MMAQENLVTDVAVAAVLNAAAVADSNAAAVAVASRADSKKDLNKASPLLKVREKVKFKLYIRA